ncbi:UPF0725 protein At1g23970-like [Raphanus sativus]|uniref:UPF0725 protein At1g23970-like n=1 Tax=Raphanus sativus TaxID=3726 RepID=A0A6J0JQL9_RAPSA|nr:UPF0725 protein At1g23970-like [Raphanus sativus]
MTTTEENVSEEEYVSAEEYARVRDDYWRVVQESEGFDLEDVSIPSYMCGTPILVMRTFQGHNDRYPYVDLVKGYCMAGLQRYNIIQGTNYQLSSLIKFNMTINALSSYYLTLLAQDPDVCSAVKTFQVRIDEKSYGRLDFTCSVSRIKEEAKGEGESAKEPFVPHYHGGPEATVPFVGELPRWPSEVDLSDGKRFYMVKRSELEANYWILTYLVLVIYSHDKLIVTRDRHYQSKLEIINVVIETSADDSVPSKERLKAKSAQVYITFKGLAEPQAPRQSFEVGLHVERRAIVRRVICESTGAMSLLGKLCDGKFTGKHRSVTSRGGEEAQSSKKARTRRRS